MIKLVREYVFYGEKYFDIVYEKDGYITKVVSVVESNLPMTAKRHIEKANATKQYDKIFKRDEIIYD